MAKTSGVAKTNSFRIKQAGHVGAFELLVNGEPVGYVTDVRYETGVNGPPPRVQLAFLAHDYDGEIDLAGADVELVPAEGVHFYSLGAPPRSRGRQETNRG